MLNPFPLFYLSEFVPTILRILVAFSFFYVAYAQAMRRKQIHEEVTFPLIGHPDNTLILISAFIIAADGLALLLGYGTQVAAMVGILICIKHIYYAKSYPRMTPLCRLEYIYLLVILCTLIITGAGLLGLDPANL